MQKDILSSSVSSLDFLVAFLQFTRGLISPRHLSPWNWEVGFDFGSYVQGEMKLCMYSRCASSTLGLWLGRSTSPFRGMRWMICVAMCMVLFTLGHLCAGWGCLCVATCLGFKSAVEYLLLSACILSGTTSKPLQPACKLCHQCSKTVQISTLLVSPPVSKYFCGYSRECSCEYPLWIPLQILLWILLWISCESSCED